MEEEEKRKERLVSPASRARESSALAVARSHSSIHAWEMRNSRRQNSRRAEWSEADQVLFSLFTRRLLNEWKTRDLTQFLEERSPKKKRLFLS